MPLRCQTPPSPRSQIPGKKIRETQLQKVPYMLTLRGKDVEAGTVGVRSRKEGDLSAMPVEALLERLAGRVPSGFSPVRSSQVSEEESGG